jgi:hypothetical protein
VCLEDLAHHLACINRFVGATREPISVAQHAVYVSRLCDGTGYEMHALHHDDAEAYLGDVSKWVKHDPRMSAFVEAEHAAETAINEALGLTWSLQTRQVVGWADRLMVRFEGQKQLRNKGAHMFEANVGGKYPPCTPEEIEEVGRFTPWTWRQAEEAYLSRHRCIKHRIQAETGRGPYFTLVKHREMSL